MIKGTKYEARNIIMRILSSHIENKDERYVLAELILKEIDYEKLLKDSINLSWTNFPESMDK